MIKMRAKRLIFIFLALFTLLKCALQKYGSFILKVMRRVPRLSIVHNGKEIISATLDIANHPKTINELLRANKVKALTINRGDYYMFKVPVRVGAEKPEASFKEGDIAFDYMGGWLVVFLKNATYPVKANFIGKVESKVAELKPGTETIILFLP
ncbi:MAG: hypothetical protein RXO34_01305 [Nitrososphaeria archaeon]